jgi:ABC-type transport system involved in Fe-S cluster assembly fused permease/ATPase subunit
MVAVVADGGIVEMGTHPDLIRRDGAYAALFGSWSGAAAAS